MRVHRLDQRQCGPHIRSVVGPVALPDLPAEAVHERFWAARASYPRFGLRPDPTGRHWQPDPTSLVVERREPATDGASLMASGVEHPTAAGARVVLAGEWLYTEHDHGLGSIEYGVALQRIAVGQTLPAAAEPRLPLLRAGLRTFATDPRRVRAVWNQAKLPEPTEVGAPVASVPHTHPGRLGPQAMTLLEVPQPVMNELWAARKQFTHPVSTFVLAVTALRMCLLKRFPLHPMTMVAFDGRRYLPAADAIQGNFSAGLQLPLGPDPHANGEIMLTTMTSGRPISTLARAALAAGRAAPPPDPTAPFRPQLYVSWLGKTKDRVQHDFLRTPEFVIAQTDSADPSLLTAIGAISGNAMRFAISYDSTAISGDDLDLAFADYSETVLWLARRG